MPGLRALRSAYESQLREPLERALAALARRQHGVVARWQLYELGYSKGALQRRLAQGRLHQIHRGVYAVGHTALTQRSYWMAAVLAAGPDALLSHRPAAALHGLIGARGAIHVTVPGRSGRRRRGPIIVHSSTCLAEADRAVQARIPLTSVPRTLLDLATALPTQLDRAFEEAERLGLLSQETVDDLIARCTGHPGLGRLTCLVDAWLSPSDDARNEFERRFHRFCVEADLPEPAMNVTVCGFLVDALWPQAKLIVELDGYAFHGHRQAFERDRERDAVLQLAGYRVIRVTWRRLEREPRAVARTLRALLAEDGAIAASPTC